MEMNIEHRLTEVEERSKSNTHRIGTLEKNTEVLNRLATAVEVMALKQDTMSGSVDRLTSEVESLKAEPGKRWKFVVEKAIYIAVAAVLGFIFAKLGI